MNYRQFPNDAPQCERFTLELVEPFLGFYNEKVSRVRKVSFTCDSPVVFAKIDKQWCISLGNKYMGQFLPVVATDEEITRIRQKLKEQKIAGLNWRRKKFHSFAEKYGVNAAIIYMKDLGYEMDF